MANNTKQTSDTLLYEKTNTAQKSLGDCNTDTINEKLSNLKLGTDTNKHVVVSPFLKLPNEIIDLILNQIVKQQRILRHLSRCHVIFFRHKRYRLAIDELLSQQETLYQCTLVSKQFYTTFNRLLWQEPFFYKSIGERFVTCLFDSSSQQQLETVAQHIRELDLSTEYWTKDHVTRLVPCLTRLTRLKICGHTSIADTGLIQQMHHFQSLTKLTLGPNLTRELFSSIGKHCHQINGLEWSIGENGALEWLSLLVRCPLKSLYIIAANVPINETLFPTVQQFHLLTAFYLNTVYRPGDFLRLVPNNAIQWWNQLAKIHFTTCCQIEDDSFLGFIQSCPQLEHLDMVHPKLLTDASFDAMAIYLSQLSHLAWGTNKNITPDAIQRLISGCGGDQLKFVKFTNCALLAECYFTEWASLERGFRRSYIVLDQQAIKKIKEYKAQGNSTNSNE